MDSYYIKTPEADTKTYAYYTIIGDHDYIDNKNNPRINNNNKNVLAKSIEYASGNTKFFLKLGDHGKIYNPIGLYSEGTSNKFISKIGRKAWEFTEVSPKVFDLYINFLRTKNIAWLRNAEREME